MRRVQRLRQILILADRALHDLREIRDKQRKAQQIVLRLCLSAVDLDQIADGLQRVKRDAQRLDDGKAVQPGACAQRAQRRIDAAEQLVAVFAQRQRADAQHDRDGHDLPLAPLAQRLFPLFERGVAARRLGALSEGQLLPFQQQPGDIDNNRCQHQEDRALNALAQIEDIAGRQQAQILVFLRQQEIGCQHHQEKQRKIQREELHRRTLPSSQNEKGRNAARRFCSPEAIGAHTDSSINNSGRFFKAKRAFQRCFWPCIRRQTGKREGNGRARLPSLSILR